MLTRRNDRSTTVKVGEGGEKITDALATLRGNSREFARAAEERMAKTEAKRRRETSRGKYRRETRRTGRNGMMIARGDSFSF